MSEEMLKILLSELKMIRVRCLGNRDGSPCGAVIEFPVAKLKGFFSSDPKCPSCKEPFVLGIAGGVVDPFDQLARTLDAFAGIRTQAEIEFIIPNKGN